MHDDAAAGDAGCPGPERHALDDRIDLRSAAAVGDQAGQVARVMYAAAVAAVRRATGIEVATSGGAIGASAVAEFMNMKTMTLILL